MDQLAEEGIETRPLWQPMHRSPALVDCYRHDIRVADRLHAEALSLPCSTNIRDSEVERIVASIGKVHRRYR
jgi:dTDP-4-amino-4,6-dideoxygalactose transaminase